VCALEYKSIVEFLITLTNQVSVVVVVFYILTRTAFFDDLGKRKLRFTQYVFLILLFGLFSIYGTLTGVRFLGAIGNTRDLAPMIAGLIGGPIVGVGAGIIGGLHRYFLGGFTCVPCSSATILAGLTAGLIHNYRRGQLLTPLGAALFGIIFESFHMIFVMAYSRPFLQAIELVSTISLPMIFANSLGLTLFSFILINHKKQKATIAAKERIEGELGLAKEIQTSMLPRTFPPYPDRKEFDIYATMMPAKEVGGDFYDFFLIHDNKLCVIIGDVSDKGPAAALFMVISKTLLKTQAIQQDLSPDKLFYEVNNMLCPDNEAFMFVTAFCAMLNMQTGEVEYANGGHNPPMVCRNGKEVEFIKMETGIALGVVPNAKYITQKLTLNPQDKILLYTDGVTEAMNPQDEEFSEEGLRATLTRLRNENVEALVQAVAKEVTGFAEDRLQYDDITMVALEYHGTTR